MSLITYCPSDPNENFYMLEELIIKNYMIEKVKSLDY